MDCALVEENSLEGWYKNGVYIFFSISCILCIARKPHEHVLYVTGEQKSFYKAPAVF